MELNQVITYPTIDKLCRFFLSFEQSLSEAARVPFLGSAVGVIKIAVGFFQALGALFSWVAISLLGKKEKDEIMEIASLSPSRRFWQEHAASHIVHGMGNMVAGVIEAIPIAGTILFEVRLHLAQDIYPNNLKNCQYTSFMGYKFIEDNYSKFTEENNKQLSFRRNDGIFWTL